VKASLRMRVPWLIGRSLKGRPWLSRSSLVSSESLLRVIKDPADRMKAIESETSAEATLDVRTEKRLKKVLVPGLVTPRMRWRRGVDHPKGSRDVHFDVQRLNMVFWVSSGLNIKCGSSVDSGGIGSLRGGWRFLILSRLCGFAAEIPWELKILPASLRRFWRMRDSVWSKPLTSSQREPWVLGAYQIEREKGVREDEGT